MNISVKHDIKMEKEAITSRNKVVVLCQTPLIWYITWKSFQTGDLGQKIHIIYKQ